MLLCACAALLTRSHVCAVPAAEKCRTRQSCMRSPVVAVRAVARGVAAGIPQRAHSLWRDQALLVFPPTPPAPCVIYAPHQNTRLLHSRSAHPCECARGRAMTLCVCVCVCVCVCILGRQHDVQAASNCRATAPCLGSPLGAHTFGRAMMGGGFGGCGEEEEEGSATALPRRRKCVLYYDPKGDSGG